MFHVLMFLSDEYECHKTVKVRPEACGVQRDGIRSCHVTHSNATVALLCRMKTSSDLLIRHMFGN